MADFLLTLKLIKMKSLLFVTAAVFASLPAFSQDGLFLNEKKEDYKIIASTAFYLELEYYPQFGEPVSFITGNELLREINFKNANNMPIGSSGEPDLKFRLLPVILPSAEKNSITVVDFEVTEIKNFNLAPVPKY